MAINVNVQYNGGFLPDILRLTQAPIILLYGSMALLLSYILFITTLLIMYYIIFCFVLVALHGD